ncbi:MAG TPA: type III pantothenate kinase [Saprospirales bacterium]|mgnify:FL=1|nr:type III pantothenate kinase [Saprospirales bacterium]
MILAIDIGNSTVSFGIYTDMQWKKTWKLDTVREESMYYYQKKIIECFIEESVIANSVEQVVISSVVPDITNKFVDFFSGMKQSQIVLLNRSIYHLLPVFTENPYELGTDLMANALAAYEKFRSAALIVDFGTALSFTFVEPDGRISGVNIVPGMITAIKSLSLHTAQLQEVPLAKQADVLGTNTIEAIQNGIIIGYEGLVRFMIEKIREAKPFPVKVIATGGLAEVLPSDCFDETDKNLTLEGLRLAGFYSKFPQ